MWNDHGVMSHGAGAGSWLTIAALLALVALAIVAIVVLLRLTAQQKSASDLPANAGALEAHKDILKRRYADGEIDREELLERLSDLSA